MTRRSIGQFMAGREIQWLLSLALIAIVLLSSPTKPVEAEDAKSAGNMVVTASWPPGSFDVDLWLQTPGDKPVGYSNKAGKVANLLRDDLGTTYDTMPLNYEAAITRGLPAGEYIINLHAYSTTESLPVEVEIRFGMEGTKLFTTETVQLPPRAERTVIRFRLDDKGALVPGSVNHVFIPLRSSVK